MAAVHCEADAYTLRQVAHGLTNGGIITGVSYPSTYSTYGAHIPYAAGYGVSNVANSVGIAGGAPAAVPAVHGLYAGAGRYVANSAGVVHVAKRSADADAEPEAYYGYGYGYPYHGLGYSSYGYGYPTSTYFYGKRSADAEPESYYGYSTLGYHGLGYGSYGYGYPGAYYGGYRYYGKRSADAEAYTPYQVAAGHHVADAYATGHPHNVGVVTGVSYGYNRFPAYPGYGYSYFG